MGVEHRILAYDLSRHPLEWLAGRKNVVLGLEENLESQSTRPPRDCGAESCAEIRFTSAEDLPEADS